MLSNPALITADISDVRAAAATAAADAADAADAAGAAYAVVYAAAAAANADATTNAAYAAAYAVAARNKAFRHYAVSAVPNRFIVDELDRLPVDFDAHAYLAASCTLAHELKPLQEREGEREFHTRPVCEIMSSGIFISLDPSPPSVLSLSPPDM